MISVHMQIPSTKIGDFHTILCETGGRYLSRPYSVGQTVFVHFQYENGNNYDEFNIRWNVYNLKIKESRPSLTKKIKMRIAGWLNEMSTKFSKTKALRKNY